MGRGSGAGKTNGGGVRPLRAVARTGFYGPSTPTRAIEAKASAAREGALHQLLARANVPLGTRRAAAAAHVVPCLLTQMPFDRAAGWIEILGDADPGEGGMVTYMLL